MKAEVKFKQWKDENPPREILVMRFQALGDTIITLPYLHSIKRQYPEISLTLLTRNEVSQIPEQTGLFDRVIKIGGGRNVKIQFLILLLKLPQLWRSKYDAVLDLQNNKLSKFVRKFLMPPAWAEFDKTSQLSAGERTRQTIQSIWNWKISLDVDFKFRQTQDILLLLKQNGYLESHDLVVLNPAGFCESRNWPLESYVSFAEQWILKINALTQFVLLLMKPHEAKAFYINNRLSDHCVNLTGKANQMDAFSIIKKSKLVLTEDSGLMHMAWVQGIPTIALFSSSRKDWSAPQGPWSVCLDSSDLPCGPCGLEICQYGDNRCITRYSPEYVLDCARALLAKKA